MSPPAIFFWLKPPHSSHTPSIFILPEGCLGGGGGILFRSPRTQTLHMVNDCYLSNGVMSPVLGSKSGLHSTLCIQNYRCFYALPPCFPQDVWHRMLAFWRRAVMSFT